MDKMKTLTIGGVTYEIVDGVAREAVTNHKHSATEITSGTLAVARGGTGATDAAGARTNLGITPANIGASATGHKHTKSEITDFPTSMPASDVPSWAKASSKPTYTASEVGAAPAYTYGTEDLKAGTSALTTGTLHFVYE